MGVLRHLYNGRAAASLKADLYGELDDQFDDLSFETATEMLQDLHASPPRLMGDRI